MRHWLLVFRVPVRRFCKFCKPTAQCIPHGVPQEQHLMRACGVAKIVTIAGVPVASCVILFWFAMHGIF